MVILGKMWMVSAIVWNGVCYHYRLLEYAYMSMILVHVLIYLIVSPAYLHGSINDIGRALYHITIYWLYRYFGDSIHIVSFILHAQYFKQYIYA